MTVTSLKTSDVPKARLPDDYSLRLCEQLARWRYEDLPAEVVHMLKFFVLDTLGVIGGAANAPGIRELNQRLSKWEARAPRPALSASAAIRRRVRRSRTAPPRMHSISTISTIPRACTPTASCCRHCWRPRKTSAMSAVGISCSRMRSARELHARLGLACYNSLGKGWHPTMVFGTPAASLGAARLLKLDAEGMRNALGMAFHQTSGSAQSMRDGVLSKRLGAGFAARCAVLGAFLAADGLTGTRRTLEGNAGLFALYERDEVEHRNCHEGAGHALAHHRIQLQAVPVLPLQSHADRAWHQAARTGT